MTEHELATLISEYSSQGGTFFGIWVTIVSGYLITAFLAGERLNRSQVIILNTFYLWVSSMVIISFTGSFNTQAHYIELLKTIAPDSPQMQSHEIVWATALTSILGVIATLKFMWDIRHPKKE